MDDPERTVDELTYLLDRREAAVLRAAGSRGGRATLSEVAGDTGLSRGELYHLFGDLDAMALVRSRHAVVRGGIERPVALTTAGEEAIEQGILDEFEAPTIEDDARRIYRATKWLEGVVHR